MHPHLSGAKLPPHDSLRSVRSMQHAAEFETETDTLFADTCEPLAEAAARGAVKLEAFARASYPGHPFIEDALAGVCTMGYWDAVVPQTWGLDWHRNEGIEITYLAKGGLTFAVAEQEWQLQAGQLTVTRPWQQHRVGDPNVSASELHWIIVDVGVRRPNQVWRWPDWVALTDRDRDRLTELLQHNEHAVWQANEEFGWAFERIAELVRQRECASESEMRIVVSAMLLELLRTLESHHIALDESLTAPRRNVALFLEDLEHRLDRRWTLEKMARACAMGRTQFAAHCKELKNLSPMEYLNYRRLTLAAKLLRETVLSISDVAAQCGFDTTQYFSTRFKRFSGLAPAAYRRAMHSAERFDNVVTGVLSDSPPQPETGNV